MANHLLRRALSGALPHSCSHAEPPQPHLSARNHTDRWLCRPI